MRFTRLVLAAAAMVVSVAVPATPASAGPTVTTLTLLAGTLSISVPATADINGEPGVTATGSLGPTTVTDARGNLVAAWTATVSITDFTTGGQTAAETITKSNVSYWSGPATATTGLGTFTPGQLTESLSVNLATPETAFALTAGVGNNTATWNPTLVVAVPASAVSGIYTGTVTHSVA